MTPRKPSSKPRNDSAVTESTPAVPAESTPSSTPSAITDTPLSTEDANRWRAEFLLETSGAETMLKKLLQMKFQDKELVMELILKAFERNRSTYQLTGKCLKTHELLEHPSVAGLVSKYPAEQALWLVKEFEIKDPETHGKVAELVIQPYLRDKEELRVCMRKLKGLTLDESQRTELASRLVERHAEKIVDIVNGLDLQDVQNRIKVIDLSFGRSYNRIPIAAVYDRLDISDEDARLRHALAALETRADTTLSLYHKFVLLPGSSQERAFLLNAAQKQPVLVLKCLDNLGLEEAQVSLTIFACRQALEERKMKEAEKKVAVVEEEKKEPKGWFRRLFS